MLKLKVAGVLNEVLLSAVSGGPVQSALRFPKLCEILPQLLPRHFLNIMHLDNEILDNLENALSVTPWVFGFSSVSLNFII